MISRSELSQRRVELSEKLKAVCSFFWNQKQRCKSCPLMSVCHEPVQPLTYEGLDAHAKRLNAAADDLTFEWDEENNVIHVNKEAIKQC